VERATLNERAANQKDNTHRHSSREHSRERANDNLDWISIIRGLGDEEVNDVDEVYGEYRLDIEHKKYNGVPVGETVSEKFNSEQMLTV